MSISAITSTVGERVRKAREARGLTQEEFGQRLGYLSQENVKCLEEDTTKVFSLMDVTVDTILEHVSEEFGISLLWLKTGLGSMETDDGNLNILINKDKAVELLETDDVLTVTAFYAVVGVVAKILAGGRRKNRNALFEHLRQVWNDLSSQAVRYKERERGIER